MSTTAQPDPQGKSLTSTNFGDEFQTFMNDFLAEKATMKEEDEKLREEEEANASYQQAAAAFFTKRNAETTEKRRLLNERSSEHNKRYNVIEPPKTADTPTSDSTQPAPAIQPPLSDEEYDKRKALSKLLDKYAGKPDNERPEAWHLCDEADIEFHSRAELREKLWMKEGEELTYPAVRHAVNTQLSWRLMSDDERKAAATANTKQSTNDGHHGFGQKLLDAAKGSPKDSKKGSQTRS